MQHNQTKEPPLSKILGIIENIVPIALGLFLIKVGIMHFTEPDWFEPIVPKILGSAKFWVYISGAAEITLGIGLIIPLLRKWSGYATAAFLILIYPANLNMWINNLELGDGTSLSPTGHFIRLIIQVLAVSGCIWISRNHNSNVN
ncbi:MAG TPA: hypothetical protein DEB48_03340 [Verrucomicrobiales bacterium]|nr:hypothetical protein [Verrucomicrobiales bacterium]